MREQLRGIKSNKMTTKGMETALFLALIGTALLVPLLISRRTTTSVVTGAARL
jgi:hypothetical protein